MTDEHETFKLEDVPNGFVWKMAEHPKGYPAIKIEDGLSVKTRKEPLDAILSEPLIKENFDLNIKRLNRWWWSVYFKKKEK